MTYRTAFQVLVLLSSIITPLTAATIDAGELSRKEAFKPIPIEFHSASEDAIAYASRAFNLHGEFVVVGPGDGDYLCRLGLIGPSEIGVVLENAQSHEPYFQEVIAGRSLAHAVLKSCDRVIEHITNVPGFFSGKLAFVGERRKGSREVYTADLLFSSVHQLTHDRANVVSPRWSPDGSQIIYTSYYKTGFPDIFIMDLSTNLRRMVAGYKGTNTGGSFSPDGKHLAMVLSSSGNSELYTTEVSGHAPKRLTSTKALEASPCWTPDGSMLYYSSDPFGGPQIYRISLKGGSPERVPTNISKYCSEPTINPRSPQQIAFTASNNGKFQTAVFDGTESRFISKTNTDLVEPQWLNDGRHLVVTSRVGEVETLMILDSKTAAIKPLHSREFGNASMASFHKN